jgi:glycosyltransferase involved in cell wall biosynthesis
VIPPRQIEKLAVAVSELLSDHEKCAQFGKAARKRFDQLFALEVTAENLVDALSAGKIASLG